jgi:Uma2 family endonuclease
MILKLLRHNTGMSTKVLMSVDEYLRTSFDGADCEYLDGEVVERNMGEYGHGRLQFHLGRLLGQFEAQTGICVALEVRIRVSPQRYRIPDISVWRDDTVGGAIPTVAPFIAVEILSPDDRMTRMVPKIQEYLGIGVEYVWVVDPQEKNALCFTREAPGGSLCDVLRTQDPRIEIPLSAVFDIAPRSGE